MGVDVAKIPLRGAFLKSNCLLEALKAKVVNPRQIVIHKSGSWRSFRKQWPHFYWHNRLTNKYYSYRQKDTLPWISQLWYEGDIVEREYRDGG